MTTGGASATPVALRHAGTGLVLHRHKETGGTPLLLLHELRSSSSGWSAAVDRWEGSVGALDFSGHGASDWRIGGVYAPEVLLGDADAALAELGTACVVGAGVGAYVALLLAGSRPEQVPAVLLLPGAGLDGGGPEPPDLPDAEAFERLLGAHRLVAEAGAGRGEFDPRVLMAESDRRPPDYAVGFAERANRILLGEDGSSRPPWWTALAGVTTVRSTTSELGVALGELRRAG